jgi:hypothetical protein
MTYKPEVYAEARRVKAYLQAHILPEIKASPEAMGLAFYIFGCCLLENHPDTLGAAIAGQISCLAEKANRGRK